LSALCIAFAGAAPAGAAELPGAASPTTDAPAGARGVRVKRVDVRARRRVPRPRHDEASATAVIRGRELRRNHRDLSAAVAAAAGVQATRAGGFGHGATVRIRASRPEQVRWAIDDIPVTSPDGAPFDPEDLPVAALARAEVYRGATPSALGGQAIGGAVRLSLRRPKRAGFEARVGGGSYGARLVEAAAGWRKGGDGSAAIRLLGSDGDYPYRHDGGTSFDTSDDRDRLRANNAVRRVGGILRHRVALGAWKIEARYLGAWREQGLPGLALYEATAANMRTALHLGALNARKNSVLAAGDRISIVLHGGRRGSEVRDRQGELGIPLHLRQDVTSGGGIVRWRSPVWRRMTVGARLLGDAGGVGGTDVLAGAGRPDAWLRTARGGLTVRARPTRDWLVVAAIDAAVVAAERFDLAPEAADWARVPTSGWRPWSGRLSARWRLTDTIAVHGGGRAAVRVPNLAELYGNDGTIAGNALLEPESATSAFAGVRVAAGSEADEGSGGHVDIQGFVSMATDLISLVRTSPIRAVYRNLDGADVLGVEARAAAWLGRRGRASAGWTVTHARDRSATPRPLPMVPLSRWWVRADATARPGWRWLGTVGGGAAASCQAGHFADRAATVAVPARSSVDLTAWVQDRAGRYRLALRVDNLADVGRFDLLGFPLPGRTVMATLSVRAWGGGT